MFYVIWEILSAFYLIPTNLYYYIFTLYGTIVIVAHNHIWPTQPK